MENWKKNLYIVWTAQFLAMVGMSSIVPFLPLFIRDLGITDINKTAQWSGWVFAAPFLLSFFMTPIWGSLGDKYGRKIMTLRAVFGLALAQFLIGFSPNVYWLFIIRIIQGGISGFIPSAMALIASNTPKEKTSYALGILQSATAAGTVLGPLIGGIGSDFFGFRFVFFFVAGLLTISGIIIYYFVTEENKPSQKEERFSGFENFKYLLKNPILRNTGILIALTSFGIAFIRPVFVLYVETFEFGSKYLPTITGLLYSLLGIFSTVSAPFWGKFTEIETARRNIIIASIITGSMYLLHSFIENIYLLIPVRILLGIGFGALLPLMFSIISNNISMERKGGVLGAATSFQVLGNFTGPLIIGISTGILGLRESFFISALIFYIIAFITFKMKKNKL